MPRPYLERSHIIKQTDVPALEWILDLKKSTGRLLRWRQRLMELDFEIVNRPGKYHEAEN